MQMHRRCRSAAAAALMQLQQQQSNSACTNLAARSCAVAAAALSALRWLARFDRRSIVRPPLKLRQIVYL